MVAATTHNALTTECVCVCVRVCSNVCLSSGWHHNTELHCIKSLIGLTWEQTDPVLSAHDGVRTVADDIDL
jgi:hypothetical protein